MNYYNPYYFIPASNNSGIFSMFSRGLNINSILNGAQRALGLFNQALPLIKEAAPMMRNARTMFKVINEFKKMDIGSKSNTYASTKQSDENNLVSNNRVVNNGGPTFFA